MNIFPIHNNPKQCVQMMCDQHIVKILTEAVEIYSSALKILYPETWDKLPIKYKSVNTPIVKWAVNDKNRYWLCYYIYWLNQEYMYRYRKQHKAYSVFIYLSTIFNEIPYQNIKLYTPKSFILCMPDEFKCNNSIKAYRQYYKYKSKVFKRPMRWTNRPQPKFLKEK